MFENYKMPASENKVTQMKMMNSYVPYEEYRMDNDQRQKYIGTDPNSTVIIHTPNNNNNNYPHNNWNNYYPHNNWNNDIKEPNYIPPHIKSEYASMKKSVLGKLDSWVDYGNKEAKRYGTVHALREVSAITYLIGMGYPSDLAHMIVESWEVNEKF